MSNILKNKVFVLTKEKNDCIRSVNRLVELGVQIIFFPTIKVKSIDDFFELDTAIKNIGKYDYLIFTSGNAVKYFCNRLLEIKKEIKLDKLKVITTGSKTKKICEEYNIAVDLMPLEFSAKGITELLKNEIANKNVLIPSSSIARDELEISLLKLGATVDKITAYEVGLPNQNDIAEDIKNVLNSDVELYIFTSPSTFDNFLELTKIKNPKLFFEGKNIAAIGNTTAEAIKEKNISVNIIPDEFTLESLSEKIINYYS